jgi:hypothetical protein
MLALGRVGLIPVLGAEVVFMQLNGWIRLMIVTSVAWSLLISVVAFSEYPKAMQDRSDYWVSYSNPFDAFDSPSERKAATRNPGLFDDLIPPARVDPNLRIFALRGALPIILLWVIYGAFVWVRRGFNSTGRA